MDEDIQIPTQAEPEATTEAEVSSINTEVIENIEASEIMMGHPDH